MITMTFRTFGITGKWTDIFGLNIFTAASSEAAAFCLYMLKLYCYCDIILSKCYHNAKEFNDDLH